MHLMIMVRFNGCEKVWDLRKNEVVYKMQGHADTITGIELSPDGSYLLTTAMDNTGITSSVHIGILCAALAIKHIRPAVYQSCR